MSSRLHQHRGGIADLDDAILELAKNAACHPLHPFAPLSPQVASLQLVGGLLRQEGAVLAVFHLSGDLATLDLPLAPVAMESARRDQLWRRSCFECFLSVADAPGYCEVNLCPDGCWNVYRFSDYRRDMAEFPGAAVRMAVVAGQQTLTLVATLSLAGELGNQRPLQAGLSAVLLHRDGPASYWALDHAASEPDFHDRRGFLYNVAGFGIDDEPPTIRGIK